MDIDTADFTSGYLFDNLTGNSEKLYRLEITGETQQNIRIRPNNDTGTNYVRQRLRADVSSVAASANSSLGYLQVSSASNTAASSAIVYIYPKSGGSRPVLSHSVTDEDRIDFRAQWWTDSISEMTSMKVYSDVASTLDIKIKLWRLK